MTDDTLTAPPLLGATMQQWIGWVVTCCRFHPEMNCVLRQADVQTFSGLGRSALDELVEAGEFPPPFKLSDSGRAKGWDFLECVGWKLWRMSTRGMLRSQEGSDLMEAVRGLRRRRA
jgi:predicted DNA-binding transcriptional regulator AlpA